MEYIIVALVLIFAFFLSYTILKGVLDLEIDPDSVEYAVSAYNLYEFHDFRIFLNHEGYYSRYPFGYPLLIIPFYALFGAELQNALYSSLFFYLGSVFLVYLIARKVFGTLTAVIAMLLVSISPAMLEYSRFVMSETASIFFTLLITWLIISLNNKKCLFFAGILAGFLISIKFSNFMIVIGFIILILSKFKYNKKCFVHIILFCLGILVLLTPLFYYNLVRFGGLLRTGQHYWLPDLFDKGAAFSTKYLLTNIHGYGIDILGVNFAWGTHGMYYQLAVAVFILVGIYKSIGKKEYSDLLKLTLVTTSLLFLVHIPYMFLHPRFMMITVPLITIFGAYGIVLTLKSKSWKWVFILLALIILLNTIDLTYEIFKQKPGVQWRFKIVTTADKYMEDNSYLISSLNGAYVNHYFLKKTNRMYIPLSQSVEYINLGKVCPNKEVCKKIDLFAATENKDKIIDLLKKEILIYIDDYSCWLDKESCSLLAKNFQFNKIAFNDTIFYKLQLQPDSCNVL